MPYIALKNTYDKSKYFRILTGYYTTNSILDFYIGIKQTTIYNTITANDELVKLAKDQGYDLKRSLNRDEQMYMLGFNYTIESKKFIYELNMEYDKFIRDRGLDYIDYNFITDATISYKLTNNILLFSGAKIMYRQLNGIVPYLYNQYTQTSYDHKYGWARFGVQYSF